MFKKLENNRPFLKMAFEGFAGDGKSFTATRIAIGLHKLIKSDKPVAIFDTEKAFKALANEFKNAGIEAVVNDDDRSLASLSEAIKWCEAGNSDILIIDSITHVWESFLQAYMNRPDKNGRPMQRNRLEFQDWGVIKPKWKAEFSTPFVQATCHIIFTGRAGYEYQDERNEETGKREIFKSGIKMKAETETAFEPDVLVLMEKKMDLLAEKKTVTREATVIKDRTNTIDGKVFVNPTFEDFYPAIKIYLDGTLQQIHGKELPDTFADFDNKFSEIGKERAICIAEIEGCFSLMGLGTGAKDKQLKAWVIKQVFRGASSLEAVEKMSLEKVKEGLLIINDYAEAYKGYLSECLDMNTDPDPKQLAQIMKELLATNTEEK